MDSFSVLIIDDSDDDRYLLKRQLKELNVADVFDASDGVAGLQVVSDYGKNATLHPKEFPPLVIFLDINMPRMGGLEFLKKYQELRRNSEFRHMILLMFTSSEDREDQKKAMSYDFVRGYVVKMPKSAKDLEDILKKALSAHARALSPG